MVERQGKINDLWQKVIFVSRIERLGGSLDEIVLFSVHKFSVIMSHCNNTLS